MGTAQPPSATIVVYDRPNDDEDLDGDGYSIAQGDCDDAAPEIAPDAEEVGGNGIDENCDGSDISAIVLADLALIATGDPGTHLGAAVAKRGTSEAVFGAADTIALIGPNTDGAAYGWIGTCNVPSVAAPDLQWGINGTESAGALGYRVATGSFGDLNTAIAAPYGIEENGTVYLFYAEEGQFFDDVSAPMKVHGDMYDGLGREMENVGDMDGDGFPDLAITSSPSMTALPSVIVVPIWDPGDYAIEDVELSRIYGTNETAQTGKRLSSVGDQNGDGTPDLFVNELRSSTATLVSGAVSGTVDLQDVALATFVANGKVDYFAYEVAGVGDLNDDDHEDFVVAATLDSTISDRAGSVYFYEGPVSGTVSLEDATASMQGESAFDWFGYRVRGMGDYDQDGRAEVAISAPRDAYFGAEYPGRVYVVEGPFAGDVGLSQVERIITSGQRDSRLGVDFEYMGDVDGNGVGDLLIGMPGYDTEDGDEAGAVSLVCL